MQVLQSPKCLQMAPGTCPSVLGRANGRPQEGYKRVQSRSPCTLQRDSPVQSGKEDHKMARVIAVLLIGELDLPDALLLEEL